MWKPATNFDEEVKVGDRLSRIKIDISQLDKSFTVTAIGRDNFLGFQESVNIEYYFSKDNWQVWREPVLWFPSTGEINWFVSPRINPTFDSFHYNNENMTRYEAGNLFRTREQAQQAAEEIKKVLVKIHEDLGE